MPKNEQKKQAIASNQTHQKDTGSIPVQIAILTQQITKLTEHLKTHPKDDHGRRGLLQSVGRRRKLLTALKDRSKEQYEQVIKSLGLRH